MRKIKAYVVWLLCCSFISAIQSKHSVIQGPDLNRETLKAKGEHSGDVQVKGLAAGTAKAFEGSDIADSNQPRPDQESAQTQMDAENAQNHAADQSSLQNGNSEPIMGESLTDSSTTSAGDTDTSSHPNGIKDSQDSDEREKESRDESQADDSREESTENDQTSIDSDRIGDQKSSTDTSAALSRESDLSAKINKINELKDKGHELEQMLLESRIERNEAEAALHEALGHKNSLHAETKQIVGMRHRLEFFIDRIRNRLPEYDQSLRILRRQAENGKQEIARLRNEQYWSLQEQRHFLEALRDRGLEQWVEKSVKDSVGPLVSDALVQGTVSVVEPMIAGIEKLAAVNNDLSNKVSVNLRNRLSVSERPFYAGFVTYVVLLFPLVLVISVIMKIKRSVAKLSLGHGIILSNFYFLILSGGCFVASSLGSVDVLLTFRHQNEHLFDFSMATHGLLYGLHAFLHLLTARQSRNRTSVLHMVLILSVGLHFFVHSYRHTVRHEDPHVDRRTYLVYTGIFTYVLYELTVKQVQKSQKKESMTLNNPSIGAPENAVEARAGSMSEAIRPSFPERRTLLFNREAHIMATSCSNPERQICSLPTEDKSLNCELPRHVSMETPLLKGEHVSLSVDAMKAL